MKQIQITHFSDVLCVWAYVSQVRINELIDNFGENVDFEYLFFSVFGNAVGKIDKAWEKKGGRDPRWEGRSHRQNSVLPTA